MKKFMLTLLAVAALAPMFVSCEKSTEEKMADAAKEAQAAGEKAADDAAKAVKDAAK